MSFKTILVHLESEGQADHLLKAAVRLAGQNEAHLIGTYVAHPLELYVARAGEITVSAEITKILMKNDYERAAKLEKMYEAATREQNLVAEWRFDKSVRSAVTTAVLEQARCADVLMISAELKDSHESVTSEQTASVITNCSRPTIVVPEAYEDKSLGDYVFVAWDGSRESSRAVFDALPVLQSAKNVWLHRVKSSEEAKQHGDAATRELAEALARHDVKLETSDSTSAVRGVGQEILTCAGDRGADCIVMGAYGHSRLHGFLLGDVTRHVLANSTVPLIMSH